MRKNETLCASRTDGTPVDLSNRLATSGPDLGQNGPGQPEQPDPIPPGSSTGQQQSVLLLDDEAEVLANLRATLEQAGFAVTPTQNLGEGLEALERGSFHLVVSDLYVGQTELGYELADAASRRSPPVPVIMLTGRPSFSGAAEALENRVAKMLAKPVDPLTLVASCRQAIHEHELRRWNEELEAQNQVLAEVLPRAIEVKDPTTSGHAERVVLYTDTLAQRCGVSTEDRASLRLAAMLHDVGKIGIPDAILTKPGGLTAEEREVINRHPAMGYEILAPLKRHENVRRWVYQHHERWDGRGYPEKLKGDEVELPGRILILAEVYDALAEERSYKKAWETPGAISTRT